MQVAILIFEKLTALDAIGPYEVLRSVPGWEVKFVGPEKGPIRTDSGALGLSADFGIDEAGEADIVLVPGGEGNRPLLNDEAVLSWLRRIDEGTKWTTSVCTGSLVLGAAGLLAQDGLWLLVGLMLPALAAGVLLGHRLHSVVPAGAVVRAVYAVLLLAGASLLLRVWGGA